MEVAGQWRREWAGAAEYGKRNMPNVVAQRISIRTSGPRRTRKPNNVTEGGVTRRVARALEVVHASGPGARMRVMRAAWHSSSGPGAGASYMVHSSRRVISSGSSHLMSPSLVTKPLEISSTPLDISPEGCMETNDYNVTEPDDHDISKPSKWRASTTESVRMPSEESSSADNASVIDLDPKINTVTHSVRKMSCDSENSETCSFKKRTSNASPILDAPVSLSTLKYKSLLNNTSNNWHDRRKSYSFENTSPLKESDLYKKETAMESSTDSGICKSSEIVNENADDDRFQKFSDHRASQVPREETFKDWLARNRPKHVFKGVELKPHREYRSPERADNPITVQSTGKVSITLPNHNVQGDCYNLKGYSSDDTDRKLKKVEFCKTELHFAAESGKVNIIATDNKPPPSNDFRKRKSAFVPIHGNFEKPITLFGDKFDNFAPIHGPLENVNGNDDVPEDKEIDYDDENLTTTKSILKNRIPKPKPYFLGENASKVKDEIEIGKELRTFNAVSLINEQLQIQQRMNSKKVNITTGSTPNDNYVCHLPARTTNKNSSLQDNIIAEPVHFDDRHNKELLHLNVNEEGHDNTTSIKHKLKILQASPVMQPKAKTRQLRDSELTYFGISNNKNERKAYYTEDNLNLNFNSVRLIQQAENNMSDQESERIYDTPEYQNLPIRSNYMPIPLPRNNNKENSSMKHHESSPNHDCSRNIGNNEDDSVPNYEMRNLETRPINIYREAVRSRVKNDVTKYSKTGSKSRSHSEPPKDRNEMFIREIKFTQQRPLETVTKKVIVPTTPSIEEQSHTNDEKPRSIQRTPNKMTKKSSPLYENIKFVNKNESVKKQKSGSKKSVDVNLRKESQKIKESETVRAEKNKVKDAIKTSEKVNDKKLNDADEKHGIVTKDTTHNEVNDGASHRKKLKETNLKEQTSKRKSHTSIENKNGSIDRHHHTSRSRDRIATKSDSDDKNDKNNENGLNANMGIIEEHPTVHKDMRQSRNRIKSRGKLEVKHRDDINTMNNKDIKQPRESSTVRQHTRNSSEDRNKTNNLDLNNTNRKTCKKSGYVINYDDKNGTFSSISKIRHGTSKGQDKHDPRILQKRTKDNGNETKTQSKQRNPLLQSARKQWIEKEHNKWKSKRTCQLL